MKDADYVVKNLLAKNNKLTSKRLPDEDAVEIFSPINRRTPIARVQQEQRGHVTYDAYAVNKKGFINDGEPVFATSFEGHRTKQHAINDLLPWTKRKSYENYDNDEI